MAADPSPTQLDIDPVLALAKKRFARCVEWESVARERFLEDLKFSHGDSDNTYQWPNSVRRQRDGDKRPCLTLNVTRQHNLQIVNDMKQNKSGVRIKATGNGATKESADVLESMVRHIEYISNAQSCYMMAVEYAVDAGIGWWRLVTDYCDGDSFDQDIFIRRVEDPLSILMDPDCQEKDCSDARYAFVFDLVPKDEFDEAYPEFRDQATLEPLGTGSMGDSWITEDHVRICEYFLRVPKEDRSISFVNPRSGVRHTVRESKIPPEALREVLDDPQTRWRTVWDQEVQWKLVVGEKIIDETVWPGSKIPLIRVIGEETKIGGILDRKGHTRGMKDAQRMYNYNASSQVEFVALQSRTPWVAPVAAIEEYETYYNTANTANHSVLPYNHLGDDGNPIPPPQRQEPPNHSPAFEAGMQTAFNQMMMTSGQWQNQMGMGGNERTGAAIGKRQAQGEIATYHFNDNYQDALRYTGKLLIELIPKVYDTKRVIKCLADDGTDMEVEIDPAARLPYFQQLSHQGEVVKHVFNPQLGKYDVMADAGAALGTKREDTVQALSLILTQNPGLTNIIGDLLLSSMDFPEAQEAAQRMKRMVPPVALGQGPSPSEQQAEMKIQALTSALSKALEATAKDRLKLVGKDQMRDIDVYRAETDRLKVLVDQTAETDPQGVAELVHQLVGDSLAVHLKEITRANGQGVEQQAGQGASSASAGAPPANALLPPQGAGQ